MFWQAPQIPWDGSSTPRLKPCEIAKHSQDFPRAVLKAFSTVVTIFLSFLDLMSHYFGSRLLRTCIQCVRGKKKKKGIGRSNPWFMLHALCPWHASGVLEHPLRHTFLHLVLTLHQKSITEYWGGISPDKNLYLFKMKKVEPVLCLKTSAKSVFCCYLAVVLYTID